MVPHYVLVLLGGPAEALLAVVAAMRVVLGVYGDDVALEARGVRGVILAVLALVDLAAAVRLHVLLQLQLEAEAAPAALALEGQVLGVHRQDVAAQRERVRDLEVAVSALVDLVALVSLRVLLEF